MPLEAGRRLGPYEILGPVGAGGMGEVYRARDHRLGRTVAVKILPLDVAHDPGRLKRFEFEARAAASLNHPNILAVHDVGTEHDTSYVVTELLEGQTLRQLLRARPLPPNRAHDFACQIAEGLAAVHGRGLVHRDLKPGNIFITIDGRAKILDFGLSRQTTRETPPDQSTQTATSTSEIVGTPGYMAPEQVRGEPIDSRTDVFAFGVVLYEMLSGRSAFSGTSSAETMTAVLRDSPPPLTSTPERPLPSGLIRVVERCLEKDQNVRFQSTTDLAFALRNLSQGHSGSSGVVDGARRSTQSAWLALAGAAVVLVASGIAWALLGGGSPSAPVTSFLVAPPEQAAFGGLNMLAVSPDGRYVVMSVDYKDGASQLFIRSRDNSDLKPIPGTEGGVVPFWSPDSHYVGFFTRDSKLKKVPVPTGEPQIVCDVGPPFGGASWNRNGVIIFSRIGSPILKVSAAGGVPVPVTALDASQGEKLHTNPVFLPDDNRFLYFSPNRRKVFVASLDSTISQELLAADSKALYVDPGYLLFMRKSKLFAQAFDARRLETHGEAVQIAQDVFLAENWGSASFSGSNTGLLGYMKNPGVFLQLGWRRQSGTPSPPISFRDAFPVAPSLAPDGSRVAFVRWDQMATGPGELWIHDLIRGGATRQGDFPVRDAGVWSPDGRELAFASFRDNRLTTYRKLVGSVDGPQQVADSGFLPTAWSPDGRFLIGELFLDIAVLTLSDGKVKALRQTPSFAERHAKLSPDGRWLAYHSNESRSWQVYLQTYPPNGQRWQVSTSGGAFPQWRGDGKELYFITERGDLMKVSVRTASSTVELGKTETLFDRTVWFFPRDGLFPDRWAYGSVPYSVTRDGSAFLTQSPRDGRESITVVVNWPESVNLK